jgi:hypothetical protein
VSSNLSEFIVWGILEKPTSIKTKSAIRTGRDWRAINVAKISKAGRKSVLRAGIIDVHAFEPVLGHSNSPPMVPLT